MLEQGNFKILQSLTPSKDFMVGIYGNDIKMKASQYRKQFYQSNKTESDYLKWLEQVARLGDAFALHEAVSRYSLEPGKDLLVVPQDMMTEYLSLAQTGFNNAAYREMKNGNGNYALDFYKKSQNLGNKLEHFNRSQPKVSFTPIKRILRKLGLSK